MRPINIKMSAFGPYAGEINLNMNDLGNQGLYLITGDTGAGKTTIFDAICFALFGEASGNTRESSMLRSKYALPQTPTFVEMTFVHGGKEYYVKRNPEYMRPAKRGDGEKKELPNAELRKPDGSVITKVRDVNTEIINILGIDRGQFSQIAMLAQGDFLKLLLADTRERQEIFRKLFKTEYYQTLQSRLEDERRKSYGECEDAKKSVKQFISGISCDEEDVFSVDVSKAKNGLLLIDETLELIDKLLEKDIELSEKINDEIRELDEELEYVNQRIGKGKETQKSKEKYELSIKKLAAEEPRQKVLEERLVEAEEAFKEKEELQKEIARIEAELPKYKEFDKLNQEIEEKSNTLKKYENAIAFDEKKINDDAKKLEVLRQEQKSLEGAGADYERMIAAVEKLEDMRKSLEELINESNVIHKSEEKLKAARAQYLENDKIYQEKNSLYEHVFKAYRDGQAGVLADTLKEGEPCPVCGSVSHPHPAVFENKIPGENELKKARKASEDARNVSEEMSRRCGEMQAALLTRCEQYKKNYQKLLEKEVPADAEIENLALEVEKKAEKCGAEAADLNEKAKLEERKIKRKRELEKILPSLESSLEEIKKSLLTKKEEQANCDAAIKALIGQSDKLKGAFSFKSSMDAGRKIKELEDKSLKLQKERDNAHKAALDNSNNINILKGEIKGLKEVIEKAENIDLDFEEKRKLELSALRNNKNEMLQKIGSRKETNESIKAGIMKKHEELSRSEKRLRWVTALSETASGKISGKEKIMLETYIQTTYFDRIISRANLRLMKMSDAQYELKRQKEALSNKVQSGLDLGVIDHYNGSERSVKTLSGGESFMAALSLALGLSDEIQSKAGGIQIDTMFVDEGFGTLDQDSLQLAYNALAGLTEGNRLVGIISHVTELKEKIDKQIVVTKEKSGGSSAKIIV
ncbi:MAG: SMC family ATPase [Butyrivibrio sp.]|nr:SMC family ATPase [Butyrivibrio sp.]